LHGKKQTNEKSERLDTEQEEIPGETKNEVEGYGQARRLNGSTSYKAQCRKEKKIFFTFTVPKCAS
jgi:hypothetical protein